MRLDWDPEDSMYENDDWNDDYDGYDTYGEELDDLRGDQCITPKRYDEDFWEDFDEQYDSFDTSEEGEYYKEQLILQEFGDYDTYLSELSEHQKRQNEEDGIWDDESDDVSDSSEFWVVDNDDEMPF